MTRTVGKQPKMRQDKVQRDVSAYLAKLPADAREALTRLRAIIQGAAPEAEDGFSYGLPAFTLGGKALVCYAAYKTHCGFYPMSAEVTNSFADDLTGYPTAKGTIRFDPKKPLPAALVRKIVRARLREIKGGKPRRPMRPTTVSTARGKPRP